jgi:asparagine synthase (glutamine-hydrolysing)
MCGIIGLCKRFNRIEEIDCQNLESSLSLIEYRGPDGKGIWADDAVLLGHRRLSIIDLSSNGAQPFVFQDGSKVITFNGEIYNFKEIKNILLSAGYQFRSQTDTEVILGAYDYYGEDFVTHLNGMFAFCIYDIKRKKLILCRDQAGEKPLFIYKDQNYFAFSSEVKAFHAFKEIPLDIDMGSISSFFVLQYIPGTHSVYKNIIEIKPGSMLVIDLETWKEGERIYWSPFVDLPNSDKSIDQIDFYLKTSVQRRLIGDVKIGVLLSGGIDSSLISCYVKELGGNLTAFTARFNQSKLDESSQALRLAKYLGMDTIIIDGGEVTGDIFDDVMFHADEPLGDPACIPTYLLSKELARYVTVVLSGEGADELFWGYDHYAYELIWQRNRLITDLIRHFPGFKSILGHNYSSSKLKNLSARLGKLFFSKFDLGSSRWTSVFADTSIANLFTERLFDFPFCGYLNEFSVKKREINHYVSREISPLLLDMFFWLPDDLLMKVDRMTMAHSVEARSPFLDPALIQAAITLPMGDKMSLQTRKIILRDLLRRKLHPDMYDISQRKKHGFETPVLEWLKGPLKQRLEDRLSASWIQNQGIFNKKAVEKLLLDFRKADTKTPELRRLWLLLVFQTWYEWHLKKFDIRI